jgi:hypothetical protein
MVKMAIFNLLYAVISIHDLISRKVVQNYTIMNVNKLLIFTNQLRKSRSNVIGFLYLTE